MDLFIATSGVFIENLLHYLHLELVQTSEKWSTVVLLVDNENFTKKF